MSTFLNYTFQSFNFRGRQDARPFYDLVANIAAEEFGHVELVATAINTMLTGASPTNDPVTLLTDREFEIFQLIGKGHEVHEISNALGVSPKTVETHRTNIKEKLKLKNARQVARLAVQWLSQQAI